MNNRGAAVALVATVLVGAAAGAGAVKLQEAQTSQLPCADVVASAPYNGHGLADGGLGRRQREVYILKHFTCFKTSEVANASTDLTNLR